jgi:hypothetical protein
MLHEIFRAVRRYVFFRVRKIFGHKVPGNCNFE